MVRNTKRIYAVGAMCLLALSNAGSAHAAQLRGPGGGRGLAAAVQDKGMDEALDAAKMMTGFMKEKVDNFLAEVKEVESEVKQWKAQWQQLSVLKMPEFEADVAEATVTLENAQHRGKIAVSSIKDKLDQSLTFIDGGFNGPNADQKSEFNAIVLARWTLSAGMQTAASEMDSIANIMSQAQGEFKKVQAESKYYAEEIDNSIAGKTTEVQHEIAQWRGEAYGTCAALTAGCAVTTMGTATPACAAACFAPAAAIVETKIDKLNRQLEIRKTAVAKMGAKFEDIATRAAELAEEAKTEGAQMTTAAAEAMTVHSEMQMGNTVTDQTSPMVGYLVTYWQQVTVPDMKTLQQSLVKLMMHWTHVSN